MALDQPRKRLDIRGFVGLLTNADPFDLPNGAGVTMQNVTTLVPGQLTARKGHDDVTFANAISPVSGQDVMAMYYYPAVNADWIVYELTDGTIKAGRSPS